MKIGDLVKRSIEWVEDGFLTTVEEIEIGIITGVHHRRPNGPAMLIIHWPSCGISHDDECDLEVINESR